jgi:hypothetical protein
MVERMRVLANYIRNPTGNTPTKYWAETEQATKNYVGEHFSPGDYTSAFMDGMITEWKALEAEIAGTEEKTPNLEVREIT